MEKEKADANKPDFVGSIRVAGWFNTDKKGNTYLSVVLGNRAVLFENKRSSETQEIEDIFD